MIKEIIIVGAGVSGLAAMSCLVKNGINPGSITILEAQSRIGGRVHTTVEGGNPLEIGAQWVHGERGNVVFEMASAAQELNTNLQTLESSGLDDKAVFSFGDFQLSQTQVEEFFLAMEYIHSASKKELVDWTTSFGQYFSKKFEEQLDQGALSSMDRPTALALVDWCHRMENFIDGSDNWMDTCGSGHTHYYECDGDPLVTWKRGYSSLFDILLKDLPKCNNGLQLPLSDRILLNKAVQEIHWDHNGVQLSCQDGTRYSADYLIVTSSLGFLKANAEKMFYPPLPFQKTKAIQALGFGTVNKIFLKFNKPWWRTSWGGISCLRHPSDESQTKHWLHNILGFYTVRLQPDLLITWMTGEAARHVETLSDNEVMKVLSDYLKKFIRSEFAYMEPVKIIRSSWFSNPFTCGSYSFRSLKSKEANVWASDLAEPVRDSNGQERLFFAGEATHDHYYSTVHGAVESGWREGDRIAKYCIVSSSKL